MNFRLVKNQIGNNEFDKNDDEKPWSTTLIPIETPSTKITTVTSRVETTTESFYVPFKRFKSTTSIDISVPSKRTTPKTNCVTNDLPKVVFRRANILTVANTPLFNLQHHFSMPAVCTVDKTNVDASSSLPSLCNNEYFDAIAWLRGEIFIFKGKFVWRFSDKNELISGYPIQFNQMFPNIPKYVERIDAAYERKTDGAIILFSGTIYFCYVKFREFTEKTTIFFLYRELVLDI